MVKRTLKWFFFETAVKFIAFSLAKFYFQLEYELYLSFSWPEAALLFVSTKNLDLWEDPTPGVFYSQTARHSAHSQSQV